MKVIGVVMAAAGAVLVYLGFTGKTFGEVFKSE